MYLKSIHLLPPRVATCSPGARSHLEEWRIADIARAGNGLVVGTVHARAAEGGGHFPAGTEATGAVPRGRVRWAGVAGGSCQRSAAGGRASRGGAEPRLRDGG